MLVLNVVVNQPEALSETEILHFLFHPRFPCLVFFLVSSVSG